MKGASSKTPSHNIDSIRVKTAILDEFRNSLDSMFAAQQNCCCGGRQEFKICCEEQAPRRHRHSQPLENHQHALPTSFPCTNMLVHPNTGIREHSPNTISTLVMQKSYEVAYLIIFCVKRTLRYRIIQRLPKIQPYHIQGTCGGVMDY